MKFALVGDDHYFECFKVFVSKGYTLVGAWLSERDNVYSSNKKIRKLCEHVNAPILGNKVENSDLQKLIDEQGLELLIVGMHAHKIPVDCLPKYHFNIHPSPLPEGRGAEPVPGSILRNQTKSGVTFHKLTDKFDEGDILIQQEWPLENTDTHDTLTIKNIIAATQMADKLTADFEHHWQNATPQTGGSYWQKKSLTDREINWNMSVDEIDTMVRAYGRYGVNVKIHGKLTQIKSALCWKQEHNFEPGHIISGYMRDIAFACKDGFVCLSQST
ncbi:MAG: formyltransferase family protein [Pseudomonadota bacterium]